MWREKYNRTMGYAVIESIDVDSMREADERGMSDGITEPFEFISIYDMDNCKLVFEVEIVEDYKEHPSVGEVKYYYTYVNSCKIEKDGKEELVDMEGYIGGNKQSNEPVWVILPCRFFF